MCRVRYRWLYGQTDTNEEKQVFGFAKDGRTKEKRGHECQQRCLNRSREWRTRWTWNAQANGMVIISDINKVNNYAYRLVLLGRENFWKHDFKKLPLPLVRHPNVFALKVGRRLDKQN